MKKKVYLYLCGGLGNQLFQFFTARNLAIKNNADLILDVKTGFLTDFKYKDIFQLNIKRNKNIFFKNGVIIFWIYRFYKFLFKKKLILNFFFSKLIDETCINKFNLSINNVFFNKKLFLMGFYQSEKYFLENKNRIVREVLIKPSNNNNFVNMGKKIINSNSVSVCLRLYEKESEKMITTLGGVISINFITNALKYIKKKINNPTFFFFSTTSLNVYKFLDKIQFLKKNNVHIVTEDLGYKGASNNLWLLSHCRNHIISNSSFYWWGAYLSSFKYNKQIVISSNNFFNKDSCLPSWKIIDG
jgi:hypothetical protein